MEYMSQECYDKLVAELNELINVELPKVKNEISEARDKGDLSENFEYHAAKRAQGKLLGRIRFKQRVLQFARVMDTSHLQSDVVGLFRKVELTNMATNAHMTTADCLVLTSRFFTRCAIPLLRKTRSLILSLRIRQMGQRYQRP